MINDEKDVGFERLFKKCQECGIDPSVFLKEKLLELEERKRIMLTPAVKWYLENKMRYYEFAQKVLNRDLTDAERFGKHEHLSDWIERKIYSSRSGNELDTMEREALLSSYHSRCAHCGAKIDTDNMHVDHITPKRQGGSDEILNLQPLCKRCNLGKGAFVEDTAEAAARPWFETVNKLLSGNVELTYLKRYCVLARDSRCCKKCGRSSKETELKVIPRVSLQDGGQLVYDNLISVCIYCNDQSAEEVH